MAIITSRQDRPARHEGVGAPYPSHLQTPNPTERRRRPRRLAGIGAAWTVLFASVHFYWAAGGRLGTAAGSGPMSDRTWFLVYDLAAATIFVAAAAVACLLATGGSQGRFEALLVRATWWGALLALVRGGAGLAQDGVMVIVNAHLKDLALGAAYDGWFTIAGVVFLLVARGLRPVRRAR